MTVGASVLYAVLALLPLTEVIPVAVPPRSAEQLRESAQRVVVGEIVAVYQRQVEVAGGNDLELVARVKPDDGDALYVHFRRTGARPPGWTGPAGQNSIPKEGQRARLFLTRTADGAWTLLEPNGWEPVAP